MPPTRKNGPAKHKLKAGANLQPPRRVLVIDVGGSHVKILASGQTEPRGISSGPDFAPKQMVDSVAKLAKDWQYDAISIGYPGLVGPGGPRSEPGHLGPDWVGFDFAAAFRLPVRIINDAAMQALGSYEGGRMVFLGVGTGLGAAFIAENVILSLELGRMPYAEGELWGDLLSKEGLERLGKRRWRRLLIELIVACTDVYLADYVTLGGGNARLLKELPHGTRRGNNLTAFRGGLRLWGIQEVQTLTPEGGTIPTIATPPADWRIL